MDTTKPDDNPLEAAIGQFPKKTIPFVSVSRLKPEKKAVCVNCGKCCNFDASGHQPFITATDMRNWLDKGLWHVIKHVQFTLGGTKDEPVQEWTFHHKNGTCVFRMNGKCAIHSVAPLACQVYPVGKPCRNGTLPANRNKHLLRVFIQAHKEWSKVNDQWKQDKLKELLAECVERGLKVSNETCVPIDDGQDKKVVEKVIT